MYRNFVSIFALILLITSLPLCGRAQRKHISLSQQKELNERLAFYSSYMDSELIKELLDEGADVDSVCKDGITVLMGAAEQGNVQNVKVLLKFHAKVNTQDKSGRTALFYAMSASDNGLKTVITLLNAGAYVNATDKKGETPLQLALFTKKDYIAAILRKHGARVGLAEVALSGDIKAMRAHIAGEKNLSGPGGNSALHGAVERGHLEVLNLLLSKDTDPNSRNKEGRTLVMRAAENGSLAIVKTLLAKGADVNAKDNKGYSALILASGDGCGRDKQTEILQILLDNGAKVDAKDQDGWTVLIHAAHNISPAILIRFFLEKGANPNIRDNKGNTALIHIALWTQYDMVYGGQEENDAEAVKLLKNHGADVNARGSRGITALMSAAGWNHYPMLKALIDSGANVDIRDERGRSALTWTARRGQKSDFVKELLKAGSKVGLAEAILLEDFPKAREILAVGGDLKVHGPYDETILMMTAEKGQSDIVKTLLERGAEVNARDRQGMTALMTAIGGRAIRMMPPSAGRKWSVSDSSEARTEIVRTLLSKHADTNLENSEKETALSIAREVKNSAVIKLLLSHDAK